MSKNDEDRTQRLEQANAILAIFSPKSRLEYSRGIYFKWIDYKGISHRLKWVGRSRGSDFPTISEKLPFGGTCCNATMELVRWVRGDHVRPLSTWRQFVKHGMNPQVLELATKFGWPEQVPCAVRVLQTTIGQRHCVGPFRSR